MLDRLALRHRLVDDTRDGKHPTGILIGMYNPDLVEIACAFGFDWILIDTEHTEISTPEQIVTMVRVCEGYGKASIVKLATWDPIRASDALDSGAFGVQVPMVNSAAMLQEVIRGCRFKPKGTRGFCPSARASGFAVNEAQYHSFIEFQEHALIIPLIEAKEAVENLDEILAAAPPEVPIFAIGAEDLRFSLGIAADPPGRAHMTELVHQICTKIHAAGKFVSLPFAPTRAKQAEAIADDMARFHNDFPYTSDSECLLFGLEESLRAKGLANARRAAR